MRAGRAVAAPAAPVPVAPWSPGQASCRTAGFSGIRWPQGPRGRQQAPPSALSDRHRHEYGRRLSSVATVAHALPGHSVFPCTALPGPWALGLTGHGAADPFDDPVGFLFTDLVEVDVRVASFV